MIKRKNKKKFKLESLIGIIIGVLFYIFIYRRGYEIGAKFADTLDKDFNIWIFMFKALISVLIGYYLTIIIHEGGHLLFGLLSGYKFLSFRVGNLTLVKYEENFKFKKFKIVGTGGQCLMDPPDFNENNFPYIIYNAGGGILNIISSIICFGLYYVVDIEFLRLSLICFSAFGIITALLNLIPLKIGGINNDGMNIVYLNKSKEARFSFYLQLKIEALLIKGKRLKDMPYEWFDLPKDLDLKNSINLARKILRGNYYLDKKDFNKAKEIYNEILKDEDILTFYKLELPCEVIFCELMTEGNRETIDKLYTKKLKKYIEKNGVMISKLRLQYAYYSLFEKDFNKATKVREKFNKTLKTYPSKAEILAEEEFMKMIDEKIALNKS